MNNGNSTQTHGTTPLTRLEKGLLALVCLVLMCPLSLPAAVTASLHDDDALSIRQLANGNTEVGVHIADVTHYVHPNTLIDREAQQRAPLVARMLRSR